MNSTEGYKGFVTFSILAGIVTITILGFRYLGDQTSLNLTTNASSESTNPIEIQVTSVSTDEAQISWTSQTPSKGNVIYTKSPDDCSRSCKETPEEKNTIDHTVLLSNLDPNTTYFYKIKQKNKKFPDEFLSFKTDSINIIASPEIEEIGTVNYDNKQDLKINKKPSEIIPSKEIEKPNNSTLPPDGYYNSTPLKEGPFNTIQPKKESEVLGAQSDIITNEIIEEFKEAMKYQDKNYDFNKDDKVSNSDYPLFMNFIANQ